MRRIISILDSDCNYAERLAAFINEHDAGGLKAVVFNNADALSEHLRDYDMRIILAGEEEVPAVSELDTGSSCIVVLSEDGLVIGKNVNAVCKYSRADRILRDVMKVYSEKAPTENLIRVADKEARIIGIYSPVGRCGKTSFALCLSFALSDEAKTLMISLDEYSGVFRYIAADADSDLSDVIYAYRQGTYSWSRLVHTVYAFGTMEYIPPVRYPEDLFAITPNQMCELIKQIANEGGYEYVVLDIGSYGKRASDILEICDEFYMPDDESEISGVKIDEFVSMLKSSGMGDIIAKYDKLRLPYERKYDRLLLREEEYMHGELYDYAKALRRDT